MDFRSRGAGAPTSTPGNNVAGSSSATNKFNKQGLSKWLERGSVVLLICIAVLVAAIAALTFFGGNSQAKAIKKDKYQAVFLNNGQVYFGNIKELNSKYVSLQNIYYLQTSGTDSTQNNAAASGNVSLVKLGCELHSPYDRMLINSDQVLFWENLQDSGQVVKAIAQYKKDNPNGQTCSTASQGSTQQAPATNTQPTTTTPTTNTPTTKKP
jgi:hypothetical protein